MINNNQMMNRRIGNQYKITKFLGNGSFGSVYLATKTGTNELYAIKVENSNTKNPLLKRESRILNLLGSDYFGIPQVYWCGREYNRNVIVMSCLGPNLESLFHQNRCRFSLKTCLMLAFQMINRLEFVHNKGFIHRDIKPSNFAMGIHRRSHLCHILDFGLAKHYFQDHFIPKNDLEPLNNNFGSGSTNSSNNNESATSSSTSQLTSHNTSSSSCYTNASSSSSTNNGCLSSFMDNNNNNNSDSNNNNNNNSSKCGNYFGYNRRAIYPRRRRNCIVGTARFASIRNHLGLECTRRDDMESLAYILIYFLYGGLPWQAKYNSNQNNLNNNNNINNNEFITKEEKLQRILDSKILFSKYSQNQQQESNSDNNNNCFGDNNNNKIKIKIPFVFFEFLNHVRRLEFEEKPDYDYYRSLFSGLFKKCNFKYDYFYDWVPNSFKQNKNQNQNQNQGN